MKSRYLRRFNSAAQIYRGGEEEEEEEEVMCNSHFQLTSLPSFKLLSLMQI